LVPYCEVVEVYQACVRDPTAKLHKKKRIQKHPLLKRRKSPDKGERAAE